MRLSCQEKATRLCPVCSHHSRSVSLLCSRIPLCSLINHHLSGLARKFPDVKFIKAISTTCIPNYPDRNLPTVFVYREGDIKAQFIGPLVFGGMNLTIDGEGLRIL